MYWRNTYFFIVLLFLNLRFALGQGEVNISDIDSLFQLESSLIYEGYERNFNKDIESSMIFARAYLKKAKNDNIDYKLAYGYSAMASFDANSFEDKIKYLDSAINVTQNTENKYFPTVAYIMKGVAYEGTGRFNVALDNYIKGLSWAKKKEDIDYEWIAKHNIGLLKIKIGNYDEAKSIFKKYLKFEESNNIRFWNDSLRYLNTLSTLVTVYRKNEEIDSAISLNRKGMELSIGFPNRFLFIHNKGINEFHKGNFKESINNLNQSLPEFEKPENTYHYDISDLVEAYYYLGKSHFGLFENEKAIKYFKKVDSIAQTTGYLTAEIRPTYQYIIKYYKSKKDKNNQLFYINRLLYNDSILNTNFRNLNTKIAKEFDTPILLAEKEKLVYQLQNQNNRSLFGLIIAIIIVIVISIFLVINYRKRKLYKLRFDELINKIEKKPISLVDQNKSEENIESDIGISEEVINQILMRLENFEKENGFTKINLTSVILAKELKTNTKYLTKVIKHYKYKKFSAYINDLRIDYIVNIIKVNKKLQNYTMKALAKEAGFNSAEAFSKYFYKKTGIYPSYFIKKIQSSNI